MKIGVAAAAAAATAAAAYTLSQKYVFPLTK